MGQCYCTGGARVTNLWSDVVTVYIDVAADEKTARHFERRIIRQCSVQKGTTDKANDTVRNEVAVKSVFTKDVQRYKSKDTYISLPDDQRERYFTVGVGDYIVIGEVSDTVTNAQNFMDLQTKYSDNGFKVMNVNVFIYGMNTDNIAISNL